MSDLLKQLRFCLLRCGTSIPRRVSNCPTDIWCYATFCCAKPSAPARGGRTPRQRRAGANLFKPLTEHLLQIHIAAGMSSSDVKVLNFTGIFHLCLVGQRDLQHLKTLKPLSNMCGDSTLTFNWVYPVKNMNTQAHSNMVVGKNPLFIPGYS